MKKNKFKHQEQTKKDLLDKLNTYGRCCMIRCTGFGKTWMVSSLCNDFKKILYIYPSEVIKETAEQRIIATANGLNVNNCLDNITFVTYALLSRNFNDKKKLTSLIQGVDIVIFDECHLMGGLQIKEACMFLFDYVVKKKIDCKFVGVTATIERQDSFDVVEVFFHNITTYSYTLHDAIKDGLIKKPYYVYCTHMALDKEGNIKAIQDDLLEQASLAGQDIVNPTVKKIMKAKAIEIATIYQMDKIITETCTECKVDTNYMKYIIFFSTIKQLNERKNNVISWFQSAFPEKNVNVMIVSSSTKYFSDNAKRLSTLVKRDNTIDLIFCVDMLNLGYHVGDLTGIVMYRATSSTIVFSQQLGRGLSSGSETASIVFDVVDNLHRKALFDIHRRKEKNTPPKYVTTGRATPNIQDGYVRGNYEIAPMNKENLTTEALAELERLENLTEQEKEWVVNSSNAITEIDVVASKHNAKYRELIAKAVAEPMVRRCATVIELHFKRWCALNGIPYPCTIPEINAAMEKGFASFKEYMSGKIKANNLDYPLHDAQALVALGNSSPALSINVFAGIYDVSINDIVNLLIES